MLRVIRNVGLGFVGGTLAAAVGTWWALLAIAFAALAFAGILIFIATDPLVKFDKNDGGSDDEDDDIDHHHGAPEGFWSGKDKL